MLLSLSSEIFTVGFAFVLGTDSGAGSGAGTGSSSNFDSGFALAHSQLDENEEHLPLRIPQVHTKVF